MKGGLSMNKKILRILATTVLVGVLAVSFAVPGNCRTKAKAKTIPNASTLKYQNFGIIGAVPGVVNSGSMLSIDIGNVRPRKIQIGGGIVSIEGLNYGNQYAATGTNISGPSLPYSKISSVDPAVRAILGQTATSMGCLPGGAFDLEIGSEMDRVGSRVPAKLNALMDYEIYIAPIAGYTPALMALLPDGTIRILNDLEFDPSRANLVFINGTRVYTLHTYYPKAVYMLTYIPQ